MKKIKDKINLWLNIGRGFTLPLSVLPYLFAVVLAAKHVQINYLLSFLGLIGIILAHLSVNILDDYFDWKKGAVAEFKKLAEQGIVQNNNKCFYLEQNLTTPKRAFIVALILGLIAFLIGIFIALKVGLSVIIIALITAGLGFFYSAEPIKLSYRGLGEPIIGLIFGPLLMLGAYITAGASPDKFILIISIVIGLLVTNIAYAHAITDFDSDIKVGKKSFPILFGTKDNAIFWLGLIYFLAYLILVLGIALNIYPIATAITFITIPKAFMLVKIMKTNDKEKKFWMGPIPNWEQVKKDGADWFMIRICVPRNIVTEFVILFSIIYFLNG